MVTLGQPASVTAEASTGLDSEPFYPGWEPGESYVVAFQDFESVTVRFGGGVVVETGPASADYSVTAAGAVYHVTINVKERTSTASRDLLVEQTYAQLLAHGWRYWRGNSLDVIGKIAPERWRRCIEGHNDARMKADDFPNPGDGRLFAASFELTSSGTTARVFNVFGCRLDDDGKPYFTQQFNVYLVNRE